MESGTEPCACRSLVPYSSVYDLCSLRGAWEPPALLQRVAPWEVCCTRCGRRWLGESLGGGGVYGDTFWQDAPRKGLEVSAHPAPSEAPPGVDPGQAAGRQGPPAGVKAPS